MTEQNQNQEQGQEQEQDIIAQLEARIAEEKIPVDLEERFRNLLDELYSFDAIGGPFSGMSPSRVLEEVDPVAFRVGVSEYDASEFVEVDGEHYETASAENVRDDMIDEIDFEIQDIQNEIDDDDLEEDGDKMSEEERAEKEAELDKLAEKMQELKDHTF